MGKMNIPEDLIEPHRQACLLVDAGKNDIQTAAAIMCKLLIERIGRVEAENQRLTDLVRWCRSELFDEKLIDEAEFAELVADSDSGKRVSRLEGYDKIRAENAQLKAYPLRCECGEDDQCAMAKEIEALKAQVERDETRDKLLDMITRESIATRQLDKCVLELAEAQDKLDRILSWCKAYPLSVFPEPDWKEVRAKLGDTLLTQVSAANMRHVVTKIDGILAPPEVKP
jgi:hypothetical protein